MSDQIKKEESGVQKFDLGSRTVYDMREAMSGKYEDAGLKPGDVVIWSDKKIYRVLKNNPGAGATFKKMTTQEIKDLTNEIDHFVITAQEEIKYFEDMSPEPLILIPKSKIISKL